MNRKLVVKHNGLLESSYKMTVAEHRILLCCIAQVQRNGSDLKEFKITHEQYCKEFGVVNAKNELRSAARRLMKREVVIRSPKMVSGEMWEGGAINVLSRQLYKDGAVMIKFNEDMQPYLQHLSKNFTQYPLSSVAGMQSIYGIRFYELFIQFLNQKIKLRKLTVKEMRNIFELNDKYKAHKDFKKYVIDAGISDINKNSDLIVSYIQIKEGRRIDAYKFSFETELKESEVDFLKKKRAISPAERDLEMVVQEIRELLNDSQIVIIDEREVSEINGSIVSFTNQTSDNIYNLLSRVRLKYCVDCG